MFYANENEPYAAQWLRNPWTDATVDDRSILDVRADDLRGHDRCHFFAGIGGWEYALQLAGWPEDWPVWTGSCPCQPWSVAGKRDGYDDDRDLWPAFFRLIDACRPAVIFGEQVASADVIGAIGASDLHGLWSGEVLIRISEWLEGADLSAVPSLHDGSGQRLPQDEAETDQSEQEVAREESRVGPRLQCSGPRQTEGPADGDFLRGSAGAGGRGILRGNRDLVRSLEAEGVERPIAAPDRTRAGIYVREYAGGDLRLQRDGERVGARSHPPGRSGSSGSQSGELQRLIPEIRRSTTESYRLEWITRVRTDLEGIGYRFGASVLPACSVGAPHIRQRLFWVADRSRSGLARRTESPARQECAPAERGRDAGRLGDAKRARDEDDGYGAAACEERRVQGAMGERERLWPDPWQPSDLVHCADGKARRTQPGLRPLVDGVPFLLADGRTREGVSRTGCLKALGNAIVPSLAAIFVRAYMDIRDRKGGDQDEWPQDLTVREWPA